MEQDVKPDELRRAMTAIAYWHRDPDTVPGPDGCRICAILANASIDLDPGPQPDPWRSGALIVKEPTK